VAKTLLRCAAALCAGLAVWTSFPPLGWWPMAVVGVAGFTLIVRTAPTWKAAAGIGALVGLGFWLPLMSFLRGGFGFAAWGAVTGLETLWFVLLALGLRLLARARWWPLTTASLWIAQEFLRDRVPFGGFPWGRLAFGQPDGPLVRLAAYGGAPLVGLAVALAGGLLAYVVVTRRLDAHTFGAVVGLAVVAAGPLAIRLPTAGTSSGGAAPSAVVVAIQGNVPRLGLEAFAQRRAVTANHLAETEALARRVQAGQAPAPAFVVWPENADDLDPRSDAISRGQINAAAAAVGVPILVGAVIDAGPDHVRNAGIVWSPSSGPGEIYIKRHLVPFGEYLPFRGLMTAISHRFTLIHRDFLAGHTPGTLHIAGVPIADTICFEVADDTVVRQAVTGGARLLVVQTNNASYEHPGDSGDGGETAQQLAIARLRAVEHGRAVVVAATSGVSAMIAPDGDVLARTGVFTPAMLDMRLPLRDPRTIADRLAAWPERVVSLAAFVALIAAALRPRHRQRRQALDLYSKVSVSERV
jgi:apolipoprotein N-acyltransferase